jgi:hypothetical protein
VRRRKRRQESFRRVMMMRARKRELMVALRDVLRQASRHRLATSRAVRRRSAISCLLSVVCCLLYSI